MSITSGTRQGDPLSGIAFMLAALPALIKLQTLTELKTYKHKLAFVPDEDDVYLEDEVVSSGRKTESYSDGTCST